MENYRLDLHNGLNEVTDHHFFTAPSVDHAIDAACRWLQAQGDNTVDIAGDLYERDVLDRARYVDQVVARAGMPILPFVYPLMVRVSGRILVSLGRELGQVTISCPTCGLTEDLYLTVEDAAANEVWVSCAASHRWAEPNLRAADVAAYFEQAAGGGA